MRPAIFRYGLPLFALMLTGTLLMAASPSTYQRIRHALLPLTWQLDESFPGAHRVGTLRADYQYTKALAALEKVSPPAAKSTARAHYELLYGILLLDLDQPDNAIPHLNQAHQGLPLLRDLIDLKLGLALGKTGQNVQASSILRGVKPTSPYYERALREAIALDLERESAGQALFSIGRLIGEDTLDDASPNLLILAAGGLEKSAGDNRDDLRAAIEIYQLIANRYPSSKYARMAKKQLQALEASHGLKPRPPAYADKLAAAKAYKGAHLNQAAIDAFEALLDEMAPGDPRICELSLDLGRTLQKERRHTDSLEPLGVADSSVCPDSERVKALYLTGRAYARKGYDKDAIETYAQLRQRFPKHSMADDAYLLAATIHQDEGENDEAEKLLRAQLDDYPEGDMASEGAWRLAFSLYQQKRVAAAVDVLTTYLQTTDDRNPDELLRARYWQAAWSHEIDLPGMTDIFEQIAQNAPTHYYGIMAAGRLKEMAPKRFKALRRPSAIETGAMHHKKTPNAKDEGEVIHRATRLYQGGLRDLAIYELSRLEFAEGSDEARLSRGYLFTAMGVPHPAVGLSRHQLGGQFITKITSTNLSWWLLGYPLPFEKAVLKYTDPNGVDPLLLWALMREESNFDPKIRSWAGAMGLSQLMWPTAKETAKKIGISISKKSLFNPTTNIRLGAKYLGGLLKRFDGAPGLAVPSYNAGPGAINRWVKGAKRDEFDLFVEAIPYKQTRDYVKRVLGSYQTYHYLYRPDAPPFVDIDMELP